MSGAEKTRKVKLLPALWHLEGLFDAAFHLLQIVAEMLLDAL